MENNNKKTLVLSIVGILVLVIAVVGVSFAMFSFTGTGTKENVIKTGTITVEWSDQTEDNKIEIENKYPMSDTVGMSQTDNDATFDVVGSWGTQPLTVTYSVGLTDITPGTTLTESMVKVHITKDGTTVMGTGTTAGATVASIASASNTDFADHLVTTGTLQNEAGQTANMSDTFVVKTYVSDQYNLPSDASKSTAPEVTGGSVNNNTGSLHQKTTASETFSFKVSVVAHQA
jgi:hypothetical protein